MNDPDEEVVVALLGQFPVDDERAPIAAMRIARTVDIDPARAALLVGRALIGRPHGLARAIGPLPSPAADDLVGWLLDRFPAPTPN